MFASGQAVFEEDSHSSSKSSLALLLEMEQHTILSSVNLSSVLTPTCLSSPLLLLLASVHSSTLLLCHLICQYALLAKPFVGAEAPRSLTDRGTMTAALSQSPVAYCGPSTHTVEVINDLMSLFKDNSTEGCSGFLFHEITTWARCRSLSTIT